jgi:CP family cyanate transporter-like MFS transporter
MFAVVGAAAPTMARRLGPELLVAAAMVAATAGLTLRALTGSAAVFLAGSVLALAGAAIGNVLMPTLVKRYFPTRIGAITALYTTALAVGMTSGAALTGPAERAFGGDWRAGLGIWAALALVAAPPWLALAGFARGQDIGDDPDHTSVGQGYAGPADVGGGRQGESARALHRSSLARSLTLFFGCQSLNAYVVLGWLPSVVADAGRDAGAASLALALVSAMSVPMSIALPAIAGRRPDQRGLVVLTTACYAGGYLGLLCAPGALCWLSATLLGAGNGAFPLAVTLIGLRTRRAEVTTALSGLVQSRGYLLAVVGPLLMGVLHQVSGSWRVPLLVLLATLVPQLLSGLRAAQRGTVEDEHLASTQGRPQVEAGLFSPTEARDGTRKVATAGQPPAPLRSRLMPAPAAAAVLVVIGLSGMIAMARHAEPGDPLGGVSTVIENSRATSVQAAYQVSRAVDAARDALAQGRESDAERLITTVQPQLPRIRDLTRRNELTLQSRNLLTAAAHTPQGQPVATDEHGADAAHGAPRQPTREHRPHPAPRIETREPAPHHPTTINEHSGMTHNQVERQRADAHRSYQHGSGHGPDHRHSTAAGHRSTNGHHSGGSHRSDGGHGRSH